MIHREIYTLAALLAAFVAIRFRLYRRYPWLTVYLVATAIAALAWITITDLTLRGMSIWIALQIPLLVLRGCAVFEWLRGLVTRARAPALYGVSLALAASLVAVSWHWERSLEYPRIVAEQTIRQYIELGMFWMVVIAIGMTAMMGIRPNVYGGALLFHLFTRILGAIGHVGGLLWLWIPWNNQNWHLFDVLSTSLQALSLAWWAYLAFRDRRMNNADGNTYVP